jgi:hypothetical protein
MTRTVEDARYVRELDFLLAVLPSPHGHELADGLDGLRLQQLQSIERLTRTESGTQTQQSCSAL